MGTSGRGRVGGGVAREAVPLPSYTSDAPLPRVRRAPRTAALQVTGSPQRHSFGYGKGAAPLPPEWCQTVTFDNGTEFARHHQLHDLGIETFFCDTHWPWQKGGVENAIGRMRRTLPRKTDRVDLPEDRFVKLVQAYNNTPRKCLGYRTPAEIFSNQVLHLKCGDGFPPPSSRGQALRGNNGRGLG